MSVVGEQYDHTIPVLVCTLGRVDSPCYGLDYIYTEQDFRDVLFTHVYECGMTHLDSIFILMPGTPIVQELVQYNPIFAGSLTGELGDLMFGAPYDFESFSVVKDLNEQMKAQALKVAKPQPKQYEQWKRQNRFQI